MQIILLSRKRLKEQFEIFIKTAGILIVITLWFNISQKFETINFRHYIPNDLKCFVFSNAHNSV